MNVDMSNYLSAEYYMYYTTLWFEWVKIMLVNVMHSIYYLCPWSRAVLLSNTCVCKGEGVGKFPFVTSIFLKKFAKFGCNLCPKSGAACAKSGQLLRQYAFSVCCVCDPYARATPHTHVQLTFPSCLCKFGRQSTGRWLRECGPPRCFVDSELFPLFILMVFASFQSPNCELWSCFLLCSRASLIVKIWVIAIGKNYETDKGLLNDY